MTDPHKNRYVRHILDLYRKTPGTRGRARPADRRLAEDLYRAGTPAETVRAALLLAAARRTVRPPDAPPLQPVNSLHYFLPVIEEIEQQPLDPGYLLYLDAKLAAALQNRTPMTGTIK